MSGGLIKGPRQGCSMSVLRAAAIRMNKCYAPAGFLRWLITKLGAKRGLQEGGEKQFSAKEKSPRGTLHRDLVLCIDSSRLCVYQTCRAAIRAFYLRIGIEF